MRDSVFCFFVVAFATAGSVCLLRQQGILNAAVVPRAQPTHAVDSGKGSLPRSIFRAIRNSCYLHPMILQPRLSLYRYLREKSVYLRSFADNYRQVLRKKKLGRKLKDTFHLKRTWAHRLLSSFLTSVHRSARGIGERGSRTRSR